MRKFITIVLSAVLLITSANLPSMLVNAEEAIGGSEITETNSNTDEQGGDQVTAGENGNSDITGTENETNIIDGNSGVNEEDKQEDKTLAEEIDPEKGDRANSWRYQDGEQIPSIQSRARAARSYHPNATRKGIDVSEHNGIIDWAQVKASGIDFAIIRCGYGMDQTDQDDKQWLRNVTECERLGIPYGVYIYSYATNTDRAKSEAEHVLRLIQGRNLSYPVYFDMEDESTEKADHAAIAQMFCNTIKNAGYAVGVYANTSWWNTYLTRWAAPISAICPGWGK